MYLTKEEECTFNGEHGWANQICMKILTRLGDLFGATRLIPIGSAHVSGVSYKTLGDAPIEFLESLADAGGKTKVRATLNPQSFDQEYLGQLLSANLQEKQMNVLKQFEKMGFSPSLTCTPYYLKKPEEGSHLAWAESSAVVYANSVLGSWTNREGGPSALAAAIIGKTADYGIHKAENRQPKISVRVGKQLDNETEFGALGIYIGRVVANKIPIIQGLPKASEGDLKQLGAALASTGMPSMFHCKARKNCKENKDLEKIDVETKDIEKTIENLSGATTDKPDLVFIGCPHCSFNEVKRIAQLIEGKKVDPHTELWVCTSHYVKEKAKDCVEKIERSGAHVLAGVCTVVSWTEKLGIKTIMTNSSKTAYYAPTLNKAETMLAPLKDCIATAVGG